MPSMINVLVVSTIGFSLLGALMMVGDKRAAGQSSRRIPESALLWVAALGGWPGMMIAGRSVRHKTSKTSFRIKFACCVIANLLAIVAAFYR